ncbi:MAG: LexA repressor [Planctomycetes bacterium ADurb.Bin126]|nr:MAG: LexA repressor [Planctomycetes bacterium ADurb.Bin126]HOD81410.1 S24 family peptidase [Phycisphaerae bacterium]HQL73823.1 S24 family peptidase [Phycisphaerae bacterium]
MKNSSQKDVCARIAQVRIELAGPRGKAAFAKQLGLSPSTYDYYESSRLPPVDVLVRIAELAAIDLRWLITGEQAGQAIPADHPILRRAAELLSRSPSAAASLAAFMDILDQALKFPAKPQESVVPAEAEQAGGLHAPEAASAGREPPQPSPRQARKDWVPILGRSAAGLAQFWSTRDAQAGVTALSDLIARHVGWSPRQAQSVELTGETGSDVVQLITLRSPREGELAEYLAAASIKARFGDAFALRIDGDSMSPDIRHGDLVLLSPSAPAADGRPAVVQLRGQIGVTCKLYRREGRDVHLIPLNERLEAQTFPDGQVEWALRVLARVRVGP